MRIVQYPFQFPPHACLVTGRADGDLIDFEADYAGFDPHVYLRRELVERAATEVCDMAPRSEVEQLKAQLDEWSKEIERLSTIVNASQQIEEAKEDLKEVLSNGNGNHS